MLNRAKLLIFGFCLTISGIVVAQSSQKIDITLKNETIKDLILAIERKTDYTFLYSDINVDIPMNIDVRGKSIHEIFDIVFKPLDISYEIKDKRIILKKGTNETADKVTVKGTVLDTKEEPLIGVIIAIKSQSISTVSDINGEFSLKVPRNSILRTSYLGFSSQEFKISDNRELRIILQEDARQLEDVIVVGYGIQKKSVITAAISSVKRDALEKVAPTRIDNVLKGMVSGVSITQASGQPGDGSRVRIRGIGTINDSEPLYIVDGMPIGGGLGYLNPSDVESVEVLKDAASAAIYGARGANGVILVTTKKGELGKATFNYNVSFGWQNPWRKVDVLNATEYAILMNEIRMNDGETPLYANPAAFGKGTDWQKEVFNKNAPVIDHQINASGGNDRGSYYISFGYLYQEGIVGGNFNRSNYERYSVRFNNNYSIIDQQDRSFFRRFKIGSNLSYARIEAKGITTNSERGTPLGSSLMISPILPVYEPDQESLLSEHPTAVADSYGRAFTIVGDDYGSITNPVAQLYLPGDEDNSDKVVANFWGEVELYKNLKFKSFYGADLGVWGNDGYIMPYYLGRSSFVHTSSVWSSMNRSYTWLVENTLSYDFKLKEAHNFIVLAGQSAQSTRSRNVGGTSYEIRNPGQPYLNATDQDENSRNAWGELSPYHKLASYFARISYNYAERYMVEATLRRDGSSNFGPKNKWANFPSISAGWNITNEEFMRNRPNFLSSLKLRFSWGKNGNQSIGQFKYTSMIVGNSNYLLGLEGLNQIVPGATPNGYPNPNLRWEESEQTNAGIDAYLFNGALTFSLDWYKKKTNGMLMTMALPQYIGDSRPIGNVGDMQNTGIEFDFQYRLKINSVSFKIAGNASYIRNELIKLGNENGWANYDTAMGIGTFIRAENGEPFPFFYGWKTNGIFQTQAQINNYVNSQGQLLQPNAQPGDVIFVDVNNDGVVDDQDRTKIGKGMPDWTFGLNIEAEWKGFDFSAFFHATVGNDIFDASRRSDFPYLNQPSYMLDRWYGPGSSNKIPRLTKDQASAKSNNNWRSSDLYVYDGSFLRLRNIQLGYTIPSEISTKFFIQNLRLYLSVENLFTLTKYHGFDPEISSGGTSLGVDRGIYPQARAFSVGANITF
jgi:TonB-linked SusC/RagA family outer membrane protein